jgi:hypothetical protein
MNLDDAPDRQGSHFDECEPPAGGGLRHEHEREARPQREDQRGGNQHKAARRQAPLPAHRIGERAARDLRRDRRQSADSKREPDVLFRPTEIGQVKRQERAEAHLHVGQEKVRPIEPAPAAIRYFPVAEFAPVAMLRDRPA